VVPVLEELVRRTGENAAYHVLKGKGAETMRICLYRVDFPHPVPNHIHAGDILPVRSGTGGRVLLAFSETFLEWSRPSVICSPVSGGAATTPRWRTALRRSQAFPPRSSALMERSPRP
jgi:DNA-binding IclR family transcriptional regulator